MELLERLKNSIKNIFNTIKNNFMYILPWLISIILSLYIIYSPKDVIYKEVEKPVTVIKTEVKTVDSVSVKPKENVNDADIVVNTKDSSKVDLNGKELNLKPIEKESFEFGKDYAEIKHTSDYVLKIDNKPLEPTWGIGVGYNTDKKITGLFTARIKKTPLHFWATSDGHKTAGGIMFSTNYK